VRRFPSGPHWGVEKQRPNTGFSLYVPQAVQQVRLAKTQEVCMPTISQFFGIIIQMFWREHAPPHFHAMYGEHEVLIDIRTLEVIKGHLPKRAQALVLEWAAQHRPEQM